MRILHIIQKKQRRGVEMFACQLSNHLKEAGHEVRVPALEPGDDTMPYNTAVDVLAVQLKNTGEVLERIIEGVPFFISTFSTTAFTISPFL